VRFLPKRELSSILADLGVVRAVSIIRGYGRDSLRVLCYHEVYHKDVEQFEAQLLYYKDNYRLITLEQLLDIIVHRKRDYGRCLAVTFDDGHEMNLGTAIPLLRKHGIPACFFVNTTPLLLSAPEIRDFSIRAHQNEHKFMNSDETKMLHDSGFEIGSHSHSHHAMAGLSMEEAEEEFRLSKEILEEIVRSKVRFFAFPYGGKRSVSLRLIKLAGRYYDAAFSTFRGFNTPDSNLHCLYRDVIEPFWPVSIVRYYIEGGKDWGTRSKMAKMQD
jgi:peptidoglycan/xylan/chitin deacetylase (PgdA/CDA1 family)